MAKGLRSSRNKANNSKLRSNVFGPAEDARKERLSAKLLELASKPKPEREDDALMIDRVESQLRSGQTVGLTQGLTVALAHSEEQTKARPETEAAANTEKMELDQADDQADDQAEESTPTAKRSSGRIQRKGRGKAKAAMVFPVYKNGKRIGPRLSKMQRRKSLRP
ncbi:hypothetical protein P7C71_g4704, partial [Lecanoromycetidae sp. Uapishka_2]